MCFVPPLDTLIQFPSMKLISILNQLFPIRHSYGQFDCKNFNMGICLRAFYFKTDFLGVNHFNVWYVQCSLYHYDLTTNHV